MSEEEKTRSEEVQDFKDNIEEVLKETEQVKKIAHQNIEDNRAICVAMDKLQDTLGKDKIIAGSLEEEVVHGLSDDEWWQMRNQFAQTANTHRSVYSLRRDMEGAGTHIQEFRLITDTLVASNATAVMSGSHILMSHANEYPSVGIALDTVEFSPTWTDDIVLIRQELEKIMPGVLKEFESVVADMSATGDLDLKHKALLGLRSVIFDQLLDIIAPEAQYSRTSWFKLTPPKTPFKKLRFCQAKYFIFTTHDETAFPQSMIDAVNKTSTEMAEHFDEMAEYGKKGASGILADNCYKETLTSFANAMKLKNQFQK